MIICRELVERANEIARGIVLVKLDSREETRNVRRGISISSKARRSDNSLDIGFKRALLETIPRKSLSSSHI